MHSHIRYQVLFVTFILAALSGSCAVPGGMVPCLAVYPVESANRSPLTTAVLRVLVPMHTQPIYSLGEPAFALGACSGSMEFEITHPDYQTARVRYTSPRDRSANGNDFTDTLTVVMARR
jgi:hypothetical protein